MIDVDKVLKNTIKKGSVTIGTRQTKKAIDEGKAKLVVVAKNCPHLEDIAKHSEKKKIPVYTYMSTSIDLGYTCGKAFAVSAFAVIDDGGANILQLTKKR